MAIKVGGIGFGRKKSLRSAVEASRKGDIIDIRSRQLVEKAGTAIVTTSVVFEGNNQRIQTRANGVGVIVKSGERIVFRNMQIVLEARSNFLAIQESFTGEIIFDNVVVSYKRGIDPRDEYTVLTCSSQSASVTIRNSAFPVITAVVSQIQIENSLVGSVRGNQSQLLLSQGRFKQSTVSNLVVKSMYSDVKGRVNASNIESYGQLVFSELIGGVYSLSFKRMTDKKDNPFESEKKFHKYFKHDVYIPNKNIIQYVTFDNVGGDSDPFKIKNLIFSTLNDVVYGTLGMNVENSHLSLLSSNIPHFDYKNQISDSVVQLEKVEDNSQWQANGTISVSLLNSTSQLSTYVTGNSYLSAIDEIESYIGLENVKSQLKQLVSLAKMDSERRSRSLQVTKGFSMHMVFSGAAGTGKTSMAKLLGEALYENGVLPTNRFVVATRKDLVAGYVGQTAEKTHELIKSAKGGVLFIDEAYSLLPKKSGNDFASEAVDQLVMDSEEYRDDMVIILAGYTEEMKEFIEESNTGLASRFKTWIEFPDYDLKELLKILLMILESQGVVLTAKTQTEVLKSFKRIYEYVVGTGGKLEGNARYVRNYVQDLIMQKDLRLSTGNLSEVKDNELMRVELHDIKQVEQKYIK
ncbi:AAA family ATPase [Dolosigranulum pigrum]|uniref:AAA family ATPase n=1 Tax=Dolosigranulum pigrum TaxID=29394 RepID=UPI001AD8892F|nr:AAA family ATPase [Dolosigranulum pigrum]QTJ41138.1 AAA family ATPase [Dolosigranulum pigrum]